MPLTDKDIQELELGRIGCPLGLPDRLEAFKVGLSTAIDILRSRVSMDKPKPEDKPAGKTG